MARLHTQPPRSSLYGGTSVQPPPKSIRTGARATRERIGGERCDRAPADDTAGDAFPACYFFLGAAFFAAGAFLAGAAFFAGAGFDAAAHETSEVHTQKREGRVRRGIDEVAHE